MATTADVTVMGEQVGAAPPAPERAGRARRWLFALAAATALAGAIMALPAARLGPIEPAARLPWWALLVVATVAERLAFTLRRRRGRGAVAVEPAQLVAVVGLYLAAPAALVLARAAAAALAWLPP